MDELGSNWLAVGLESSEVALASWSPGLQASFQSLFENDLEDHPIEAKNHQSNLQSDTEI